MPETTPRALAGLRVLDCTDRIANYCGKLFAELGADVVLVEPPAGNELRTQSPFVDEQPGPDTSIPFLVRNTSKRGLAADLARPEGRALLLDLATKADLLIDDRPPGELKSLGLGPDKLRATNPQLVVTSITPFGRSGPYAQFAHADLICLALGGLLWMGGYSNGPPVRVDGDQAYTAGSLFGAVGSMVAVTHAELTGEGQHVDVSVQESVTMGLENAAQFYDLEDRIRRRFGGTQKQAGFGVFPCADGHVCLIAGGIGGNRFWGNLVAWMRDDGLPEAELLDRPEWAERSYLESEEAKELFWGVFVTFAREKSKQDLYHDAQSWRVPLCPVNRPSDLSASRQLDARGYFTHVAHRERTVRLPGAPYRLSRTPWQLGGPAPSVGQHTEEVLLDYDIDVERIRQLKLEGVVT